MTCASQVLRASHGGGKKKTKQKGGDSQKKKKRRGSQPDEEDTATPPEEGHADEEDDAVLRRKDMIPPQGWDLSSDTSSQHAFTTGYPQSKVSIKVVLSFPMDGPLTQAQFASKVGMVPTTACMQILKDRLNMQVCLLGLSLSSATDADMEQDIDISPMLHTAGSDAAAGVGQSECRSLLGGRVPIADRTFYSNGDWKWGRGFQSALHALDETEYAKKMEVGSIYVDMSYVLARNRADGSNTYTNKRISSYGRWASLVFRRVFMA